MKTESYNVVSYLAKRELDTKELKRLIKDLKLVIHARQNLPF